VGESVITFRRETHVALEITIGWLPGQLSAECSGIKIPATNCVKNYADPTGKNLLTFRIHIYGATTKQRYDTVCANCEKREGRKKGTPSLVDFHAERDIIEPKGGKLRVEFSLCCYPKCRQSGDSSYLCVELCPLCFSAYTDHFVVSRLYSVNPRTRAVSWLDISFLTCSMSWLGSLKDRKSLRQRGESETGAKWNNQKEHLQQ
jgi:hypothetical protein